MIGSDGMKVSTSILSAEDRVNAVTKLNRTNTSYIHIDVMDGKFVQNNQFNKINEVNSINMVSKYPMDIHLMVSNPYEYVIQYKNMNVEFITFHVEVNGDKEKIINEIKKMGYKVGMAIKPNTDISKLKKYLDKIDMILVMSVEPGKGGQEFIHSTVDKINSIKELIGDRNILLEVDGGINDKTISLVQMVDIVVSGSYVVKSDNYYKAIESLISFKGSVDKTKEKKENFSVDSVNKKQGSFSESLLLLVLIYFIILLLYGIFSIFFGHEYFVLWGEGDLVYGFSAFESVIEYGLFFPLMFMFSFFPLSFFVFGGLLSLIQFIILKFNLSIEKNMLYIAIIIIFFFFVIVSFS